VNNHKNLLSAADKTIVVQEASREINKQLSSEGRRRFIRQGLTFGGLMLLTGCDISNNSEVEKTLSQISRFNDRIQHWLFNPDNLAPVYPESRIARPFPFNAFYSEDQAPTIDASDYRLEITGLVTDKRPWTLAELHTMAQVSQVTRHICVEGWSAIGKWGGSARQLRQFSLC
jgi:DMSO/TMAO reductase YedYZ molybdopterin-dependent catalytic subunit